MDNDFYVLSTLFGKEELAAESLAARDIEVWYPKVQVVRSNGIKRKFVSKPLFSRYVFARFHLEESYQAVRFARGILDFLRFGDSLATIAASDVQAIQDNTIGGYVVIENREIDPAFGFAIDEIVKVVGFSVWTGRVGKFKGGTKDGQNVKIELHAKNLGKPVYISVPVNSVCAA